MIAVTVVLRAGDVLDSSCEALLLTIDGTTRGLEGNIARQFSVRWPEDWRDIERAIRFPVALGCTIAVPLDGDRPYKLVLLASTLHHLDEIDEPTRIGIIRSAYGEAIRLCALHRVPSLASAVMSGGWRVPQAVALRAMVSIARALGEPLRRVRLEIFLPLQADVASAIESGTEEGWYSRDSD